MFKNLRHREYKPSTSVEVRSNMATIEVVFKFPKRKLGKSELERFLQYQVSLKISNIKG